MATQDSLKQAGRPMRTGAPRPLDGIKVLDFSWWLAGPLATSWLGDMGAEVIKVERPGRGDDTRHVDRLFGEGNAAYYMGVNRSKKSIVLDLATSEGREIALELAERADVLVENFRPGVMDRLGLGYDVVARRNPRVIYCSISAFGPDGPLARKPAMDIVVQAMGGVMSLTGEPGRPPVRPGAPIGDAVGAMLACYAIVLALYARERYGVGQRVDVPLINGQVALLANYLTSFPITGEPSRPVGGGHPQLVPYQVFRAADGYLLIACLNERFWQRLCDALDLGWLKDDPRFALNADRVEHREELIAILQERLDRMRCADLIRELEAADVPCAPVNTLGDLLREPQLRWNRMLQEIEHPEAGKLIVTGVPVFLSETPGWISSPPPRLGEHTEEVLRLLGRAAPASGVGVAPALDGRA